MINFELDASGDIQLEDGQIKTISDRLESIRQKATVALNTFEGEWFLDVNFGVPYREEILIKNPSVSRISAVLRDTLESVNGVTTVTELSISIDRATRTLSAEFELNIETGETITVSVVNETSGGFESLLYLSSM